MRCWYTLPRQSRGYYRGNKRIVNLSDSAVDRQTRDKLRVRSELEKQCHKWGSTSAKYCQHAAAGLPSFSSSSFLLGGIRPAVRAVRFVAEGTDFKDFHGLLCTTMYNNSDSLTSCLKLWNRSLHGRKPACRDLVTLNWSSCLPTCLFYLSLTLSPPGWSKPTGDAGKHERMGCSLSLCLLSAELFQKGYEMTRVTSFSASFCRQVLLHVTCVADSIEPFLSPVGLPPLKYFLTRCSSGILLDLSCCVWESSI